MEDFEPVSIPNVFDMDKKDAFQPTSQLLCVWDRTVAEKFQKKCAEAVQDEMLFIQWKALMKTAKEAWKFSFLVSSSKIYFFQIITRQM